MVSVPLSFQFWFTEQEQFPYQNMKALFRILFSILILATSSNEGKSQEGKALFDATCKACHTIGGGKLVGPDLSGVTGKREKTWLKKFIASSTQMVNSGDKDAIAVFQEFNKTVMPDQKLSDPELTALIDFLASAAPSTVVAEVKAAGPADSTRGRDYFTGMARLENGGPSCISCHHVNYRDIIAGGALAKDLTNAHSRLSGPGVTAMLSNPPFPPMTESYVNAPLTPQEIADITSFLAVADVASVRAQPKDFGKTLLYSSIAGVTLVLGLFSVIWMRRRRGTVNQEIFDRQVRSE